MYQPKQRVTVDLSNLTIQGVSFSQNVQKALGSVVRQVSAEPSVYLVELLFSFKGIKLVEVPEERMRVAQEGRAMPRRDRIAEFQEVIVRQPTAEECQAWSGLVTA